MIENVFFSNWESLVRTFIVGLLGYFALILMLRISGKRTLSQMKEFDFIVTVALGSTLATVLLSKDVSLADGTLALAMLISLQYLLAYLSLRSKKVSRLISSDPTLLFYRGEFLWAALKKERVTDGEVRSVLRQNDISSLQEVEAVVMESNGQLNVVKTGSLSDVDSPLYNVTRID